MENMKPNISEAERALTEKPMLATTAESILILNRLRSEYKDLPHPLRFSRILSILLSEVSTPIEEYDLVAGRSIDRALEDGEEKIFREFTSHPDYIYKNLFFSSGHCTYSWEKVVELGLCGLRERAKKDP